MKIAITTPVTTNDDNKRTKIALFHSSFFGRGVARIRLNLAEGLLARGYDVDLVVANAKGEMRGSVPNGARVVDLEAPRLLAALPGFYRYIRSEQPNAIISAEDHVNSVALLARKLARSDVPISVSSHVLHSHTASKPRTSLDHWLRYAVRWTYPWATSVIAVSDGLGDDMAATTGLPRDMIRTVYNPVVSPSMLALAEADCPHPWLETPDISVVLAVGRLTVLKNFDKLIRAIAAIREIRPIRLLILGDGHMKDDLQSLIDMLELRDTVELCGYVENPFAYMRRASLLALCSEREGLPGVLIQAMGCGCPVVSTDCPHGPREILDHGTYGPLTPVGDVAALSQAIARTLDCPLPSETLRERAELFAVNRIIDTYREILSF